jgi:hypothetical protein
MPRKTPGGETPRRTRAGKTVRGSGLKPKVIVAGYNKQVLELINDYNKGHADGIIVLPPGLKPIGYAFSINCHEYYYIVLGYQFEKESNTGQYVIYSYIAMRSDLLNAPGTPFPPEALNTFSACPLKPGDYEKLYTLRLPPDAEELPNIIELRPKLT